MGLIWRFFLMIHLICMFEFYFLRICVLFWTFKRDILLVWPFFVCTASCILKRKLFVSFVYVALKLLNTLLYHRSPWGHSSVGSFCPREKVSEGGPLFWSTSSQKKLVSRCFFSLRPKSCLHHMVHIWFLATHCFPIFNTACLPHMLRSGHSMMTGWICHFVSVKLAFKA